MVTALHFIAIYFLAVLHTLRDLRDRIWTPATRIESGLPLPLTPQWKLGVLTIGLPGEAHHFVLNELNGTSSKKASHNLKSGT